jgi:Na+/proline symporter
MTLLNSLLSLTLGLISGSLYGLSFLISRRRVFSYRKPIAKRKLLIALISSSALRILLLAALFVYLLRSTSIHFILLIIGFFIAFWGIILAQRAWLHERNEST